MSQVWMRAFRICCRSRESWSVERIAFSIFFSSLQTDRTTRAARRSLFGFDYASNASTASVISLADGVSQLLDFNSSAMVSLRLESAGQVCSSCHKMFV